MHSLTLRGTAVGCRGGQLSAGGRHWAHKLKQQRPCIRRPPMAVFRVPKEGSGGEWRGGLERGGEGKRGEGSGGSSRRMRSSALIIAAPLSVEVLAYAILFIGTMDVGATVKTLRSIFTVVTLK